MAREFNLEEVLTNWSVDEEESKAQFLDALYEFYAPGNGLYTGLFQRFQADITEFSRHLVTQRAYTIEDLFKKGLEL
jgi:hypothetical protein